MKEQQLTFVERALSARQDMKALSEAVRALQPHFLRPPSATPCQPAVHAVYLQANNADGSVRRIHIEDRRLTPIAEALLRHQDENVHQIQ